MRVCDWQDEFCHTTKDFRQLCIKKQCHSADVDWCHREEKIRCVEDNCRFVRNFFFFLGEKNIIKNKATTTAAALAAAALAATVTTVTTAALAAATAAAATKQQQK